MLHDLTLLNLNYLSHVNEHNQTIQELLGPPHLYDMY
jgi:hypothetical protein